MTVIRPNSVSGINSITVQSGNSLAVHKANGEIIRTITASSGVSTFSSISVGTAYTDNSAGKSINIGLGASIAQHNDNTLTFGTAGDPRLTITSGGNVQIPADTVKLQIGASQDLYLWHNGSTGNSNISNITGDLFIQGNNGSGTAVNQIAVKSNAAVEMNYQGTKKLETTSSGISVSGSGTFAGNVDCTSGRFQRGTATVQDGDAISGGININGTDMDASVIMSVFGNDSDFTRISGSKSRNASVGSHTVVNDGDVLLSIKGFGSDGTDFEEAAQIEMQVDGSPGNNDMPGRIVFKTTSDGAASPTERLRIDSSGAVNIGSNPAQATGTHTANAILTAKGYPSGETSAAILALVRGNNTTSTASGHTLGRIVFSDKQAGEYALIEGESEHNAAVGDTPGRLIFATTSDGATTPSEKARIDMNGDLIVHGTSLNNSAVAGQALQIHGTTRPTLILRGNADGNQSGEIQFADNSGSDDNNTGIRAGLIKYDHSNNAMSFRVAGTYTGLKISGTNGRLERTFGGGSGSSSDLDGMWFNNDQAANGTFIRFWQTSGGYGANQIGSITHSANNTAYNTSSDYRLKENINAITDAITRLKTLKPSRFNFKTEPSVTVDGFIAHEVTAVPEAITGTKDEVDSNGDPLYQGIDQSKLVPLLTAALQEAVTKIETLETKVASLEGG